MSLQIKTAAFVAEIDHAELTVRLLEIGCQLKRREGQSAAQIMKDVWAQAERGQIPEKVVGDFERMAEAAILYVAEQIRAGGTVQ